MLALRRVISGSLRAILVLPFVRRFWLATPRPARATSPSRELSDCTAEGQVTPGIELIAGWVQSNIENCVYRKMLAQSLDQIRQH